jgi:hypothetical protein
VITLYRDGKCMHNVIWNIKKGRNHLEDPRIEGRIILKDT